MYEKLKCLHLPSTQSKRTNYYPRHRVFSAYLSDISPTVYRHSKNFLLQKRSSAVRQQLKTSSKEFIGSRTSEFYTTEIIFVSGRQKYVDSNGFISLNKVKFELIYIALNLMVKNSNSFCSSNIMRIQVTLLNRRRKERKK